MLVSRQMIVVPSVTMNCIRAQKNFSSDALRMCVGQQHVERGRMLCFIDRGVLAQQGIIISRSTPSHRWDLSPWRKREWSVTNGIKVSRGAHVAFANRLLDTLAIADAKPKPRAD